MPKFKNGLSALQERFVREYLICLNASEAVRRAGYTSRRPDHTGHSLMKNPKIKARIEAEQERVIKKLDLTLESVVAELAKIGFANMQDYMATGLDGLPRLDWAKLTRDQAAALVEVTVDDVAGQAGTGKDKDGNTELRDVRRVKFKLADKRAALVDLGKHLGGFGSKVALTGEDGGPVEMVIRWQSPESDGKKS